MADPREVPDDTMLHLTHEAIDAFERGERMFLRDGDGRKYEVTAGPDAPGSRAQVVAVLRKLMES